MPQEQPTHLPAAWPWWRFLLTGLSTLALALCAYLSWHYLTGRAVIGCGGGSPCDHVLTSRWSSVGGVLPVSGLAAGAYLAMLVASFFIGPRTPEPDRRLAWGAMLALAGAAAGSAIWFTIVQKWLIGELCPYCMATHITGVLLAVLIIWRAPRQFADGVTGSGPRRIIGRLPAIGLPALGVILAAALATTQIIVAPRAVYRGGEAKESHMLLLDPHAAPLVGSPDAPYIVTLLFDYKCPHCQKLHAMLEEVIHRYNGRLAFILCPAPLNNKCNPYISREVDEFKDSCELAKMGLTVFRADPKAFASFDDWMFSVDPGHDLWHPRSLEDARAKAVALVGATKLDAALADPWVDQYMQASIRVYGNSINPDQSGNAVPKLVYGPRWVTPEPQDADDLMTILHASLALPKP